MIFMRLLLITAMFSFGSAAYARDTQIVAPEVAPEIAPEISTGFNTVKSARGKDFMAVTAHPDATKAAYKILSAGGTAADAGIAAQMVLGLVEPQSSGIGGGSFILYYDAKARKIFSLDGRESAPSNAGGHLFTRKDGQKMGFYEAGNGGRAVGAPGTLRALSQLYDWQGKTPWFDLFKPAINLAEDGFVITERLHKMLEAERGRFDVDTEAKLYFFPDADNPIAAGEVKYNQDYAVTLNFIAQERADKFYTGALARNLVQKVRENGKNPGLLSIEDMANYEAKERQPICGGYRGYKICSMAEPSSGALTMLMTLGMLEKFDLRALGPRNPAAWHLIAEASRLAFADRNYYMADPDFVKTPSQLLLDKNYLQMRSAKIDAGRPLLNINHGVPPNWNFDEQPAAADDALKPPGTTHISIVDMYGNILSMTSSIQNAFGSRVMVDGYLLNNELTDFSFTPNDENGNVIANRVEGGKRPRSSMSPTIIFDPDNKPYMVIGSAGGSRIIGFVLQRIIADIDWNMSVTEALKMPHIVHRGKKLELESKGVNMAEGLKKYGHPVIVGEMNSGLTVIKFEGDNMVGAADPRRDGTAQGK